LQDKDAMLSELNRELLTLKEEMKETNHNNQVMEKRLLKTEDDYETMKSKFETFKDIEIVNCTIMREANGKSNS
jgi:D-ribose pyranose/furanose isomerase RbsD